MLTTRRFLDLTAEELMSRDVVTLTRGTSLRAAAHRLAEAGISGAPVVDETGRCIGVLSKSDLVRFLDHGPSRAHTQELASGGFCAEWEIPDLDRLPADDVTNYMTTDVVQAAPETRAGELARLMHERHIHRVLITDSWGRVLGVVSSMDILGAMAGEEELRVLWSL